MLDMAVKFELDSTKGGFFSESSMNFLDLQISRKIIPKNYPELEIEISRQIQYTVGDLKNTSHFLKKSHL